MRYIAKHWWGELSLATSFWVNVVFLDIIRLAVNPVLIDVSPIEDPVLASRFTIFYAFGQVAILYPWQIVGLWRSATRHVEETRKRGWARVVKTFVVLGFLGTLGNLNESWPVLEDLYRTGFETDEFGDYQVNLIDDGYLIHLKGSLSFGISKEVQRLISKNPNIKGIVLDSSGGRIYEGRELSKIILKNVLDTYTLTGCYSSCGTAFISGNRRYLARGANLAFHQYHNTTKSLEAYVDIASELRSEQRKDLLLFERVGIDQDFIDRVFNTEQDDLWYPTVDELLNSGVVHDLVNSSDLKPIEYGHLDIEDVEDAFAKNATFQSIKKYDPETYKQITATVGTQMKKGASGTEISQAVSDIMFASATTALARTSDKALIDFVKKIIKVLTKLEEKNPILCMKFVLPNQYGRLKLSKHLTVEEMMLMDDAFSLVITDSYESKVPQIDIVAAEDLLETVAALLGDGAEYLVTPELENRDDYSAACKTYVKFYELVLSKGNVAAANALRYGFSEELLSNLVFSRTNQAAAWLIAVTSIPSLNLTPTTSFAR